jgi:hypothetical protein
MQKIVDHPAAVENADKLVAWGLHAKEVLKYCI